MEAVQEVDNNLLSILQSEGMDSFFEYWNSIKNDEILLYNAIKIVKKKENGISYNDFLSPLLADLILYDKSISNDLLSTELNLIFMDTDIARRKGILDGGTMLLRVIRDNLAYLKNTNKKFAEREAGGLYNYRYPNDKVYFYTPYHTYNNLDLRDFILLNNNWDLDEVKPLIKRFYKYDSVLVNRLDKIMNYISLELTEGRIDTNTLLYCSEEYLSNYFADPDRVKDIYQKVNRCKFIYENPPSLSKKM